MCNVKNYENDHYNITLPKKKYKNKSRRSFVGEICAEREFYEQ